MNQELLKDLTEVNEAPANSDFNRFEYAKSVFWRLAKQRAILEGKEFFIIDEQNKTQVKGFVAWITGDITTMASLSIDPKKGLLVRGNVGSGKSILFRIWADCIKSEDGKFFNKMTFTSCEKVAKQYAKGGDSFIEKYGEYAVKYNSLSYQSDKHERYVVAFDDFGNEEAKNSYGNFKEVMVDIITHRYDWMMDKGLYTHLTTNLTWQEITQRYGARIESRLRQMCNVIDIGVDEHYKDRRKAA